MKVVSVYDSISLTRGIAAASIAFFVGLFSVGLFSFGVLSDGPQHASAWLAQSNITTSSAGTTIEQGEDEVVVPLKKGGEIRLEKDNTIHITAHTDKLFITESKGKTGSAWISNAVSNHDANYLHKNVNVLVQGGVASIVHTETEMIVSTVAGHVIVELLRDPSVLNDDNRMKSLVVPPGYEMSILYSRITPSTQQLYQSKIQKEFPIVRIKASDYEKSWFSKNRIKDRQLLFDRRSAVVTFLSSLQQGYAFKFAIPYFYDVAQQFTFVKSTEHQRYLERLDYLVGVLSIHVFKKQDFRLDSDIAELADHITSGLSQDLSGDLKKAVVDRIHAFQEILIVAPGDAQLQRVQNAIRTVLERISLVGSLDESMLARQRVLDAYEIILTDSQQAKQFLSDAGKRIKGVSIANAQDRSFAVMLEVDQLLQHLLFSNPALFHVDYVMPWFDVQDMLLAADKTPEVYQERIQGLIQSRLKLLGRVIHFLKRNEFVGQRSEMLVLSDSLLQGIHQKAIDAVSDSAVHTFFKEQQAQFTREIAFLKSETFTQFSKQTFSDVAYEQALKEYELQQERLEKAKDILFDSGSDSSNVVSAELFIEQARKDLLRENIRFSQLRNNDAVLRVIHLDDATFEGTKFSAQYDTATKLLSDIKLDAGTISSGIPLSSLGPAITAVKQQGKTQSPTTPGETRPEIVEDDVLKAVFKKVALDLLTAEGFTLTDNEIFPVPTAETDEFTIIGAKHPSTDKKFVFSMVLSKKLVTKVSIDKKPVSGAYTLAEFKQLLASGE